MEYPIFSQYTWETVDPDALDHSSPKISSYIIVCVGVRSYAMEYPIFSQYTWETVDPDALDHSSPKISSYIIVCVGVRSYAMEYPIFSQYTWETVDPDAFNHPSPKISWVYVGVVTQIFWSQIHPSLIKMGQQTNYNVHAYYQVAPRMVFRCQATAVEGRSPCQHARITWDATSFFSAFDKVAWDRIKTFSIKFRPNVLFGTAANGNSHEYQLIRWWNTAS